MKYIILLISLFFTPTYALSSTQCTQFDGLEIHKVSAGNDPQAIDDKGNSFVIYFKNGTKVASNENWNLNDPYGRANFSIVMLALSEGKNLHFYDHFGSGEKQCDDFDRVDIIWGN